MKYILFIAFILVQLSLIAQNRGNVLEDANGYPTIGINKSSLLTGNGTYGSPLSIDTSGSSKFITKFGFTTGLETADKHWFGYNLVSNGNHTHDARYHISTVNHIGGWNFNFGVSGADAAYAMDSTGMFFYAPSIAFAKGSSDNPRLWIDGDNDRILFTSTIGDYRFENLTRDDESDDVAGINSATGKIVIRNAQAPKDRWIIDDTDDLTIVPGTYVAVTMTAMGEKTVTLPDATESTVGYYYKIFNNSEAGNVTVVVTLGSDDVIYGPVVLLPGESATFDAPPPGDVWINN